MIHDDYHKMSVRFDKEYMYSVALTCSGAETYSLYSGARIGSITRAHLISGSRARKLLDRRLVSVILDVRGDLEWEQGHYPGAKHIPHTTVNEASLRRLDVKKEDAVLVYCNTGHRAKHVAELLKSYGVRNVYYIATTYESIELTHCQTPSSEKYASPPALVATV